MAGGVNRNPTRSFDVDNMSIAPVKMKSGRTVMLEATWAVHQTMCDKHGTELTVVPAPVQLSFIDSQKQVM
jgi:hypothetical protein